VLFGEYHIGGSFRGWAKQIVPWRKSKMQGTQFYPAVAGLPLLSKSLLTKDWHFHQAYTRKQSTENPSFVQADVGIPLVSTAIPGLYRH
jgi:hypothetical protein